MGKHWALKLHRMGKAYGRLPTELMRETDFRYALNEIVLDVGEPEDRELGNILVRLLQQRR